MRALKLWSDIIQWRWAPTVAIALGALSYVSLAVLIIPDRLGDASGTPSLGVNALSAARSSGSLFGASVSGAAQHEAGDTDTSSNSGLQGVVHGSSPRQVMQSGFPRRGFTPPLPRPEPEVPPPAPAPPPPPPPAIVIQPPPTQQPAPEAGMAPTPPGAAPTPPPGAPAPPMNMAPGTPPPESAAAPPPPLPAAEVAPPPPPPPVP
jgi:hypothetical protein